MCTSSTSSRVNGGTASGGAFAPRNLAASGAASLLSFRFVRTHTRDLHLRFSPLVVIALSTEDVQRKYSNIAHAMIKTYNSDTCVWSVTVPKIVGSLCGKSLWWPDSYNTVHHRGRKTATAEAGGRTKCIDTTGVSTTVPINAKVDPFWKLVNLGVKAPFGTLERLPLKCFRP